MKGAMVFMVSLVLMSAVIVAATYGLVRAAAMVVPPRPVQQCVAVLSTGATVTAISEACYAAYYNGTLVCNGITYGPAAWVSLTCEEAP